MSTISTIIVLGIVVEAIIEYGKLIFVNKSINWKQVGALLLGIGLSVLAGTDLFAAVGVSFAVPYVGMVLTGIIFSRGSNYVADFLKLIQTATAKKEDAILNAGGDPEEGGGE